MPGSIACRLKSQQNPVYQQALAELGRAADLELGALGHCVARVASCRLRAHAEQSKQRDGHPRTEILAPTLPQARSCCLAELHALCDRDTPQIKPLLTNDLYLERLSHLALEHLLVQRAAPPLLHFPHPDQAAERTGRSGTVVAVLFDFPLAITHELFPLWTDAFAFAQETGIPVEVVGIHISWLNGDLRATRSITFDARLDAFLEAPTEDPLNFQGAVLVNQSSETHADLSHRLRNAGIPHVNPSSLAALADDKWACYLRWKEARIPTPETVLLAADCPSAIMEEKVLRLVTPDPAQDCQQHEWVVQPRRGTEGRGVFLIQNGETALPLVLEAWQEIGSSDDAIFRPRVGNVEWRKDASEGWHPLELRLHVTWNGDTYAAESGYVVRSRFDETPGDGPSPRVGDLGELELTSNRPPLRQHIRLGEHDLRQIGQVAVDAIHTLGRMPLAGVDLALTCGAAGIQAVVLDVNPRPAGLMRSDLFADPAAAGIGHGLWRFLTASRADNPGAS